MDYLISIGIMLAVVALGALVIYAARSARAASKKFSNPTNAETGSTDSDASRLLRNEFVRPLSPWDVLRAIFGGILILYLLRWIGTVLT